MSQPLIADRTHSGRPALLGIGRAGALAILAVAWWAVPAPPELHAQQAPPAAAEPAATEPATEVSAAAEVSAVAEDETPLSDVQQQQLIELLGSPRFAEREEAMVRVRSLGVAMLSALRSAAAEHPDPEIRSRATFAYSQIVESNFEARAEAFLGGGDLGSSFAGWFYVSSLMGDNAELREIFIEASRHYPQLMQTLEGSSRERIAELEHVAHRIKQKTREQRQHPSREDLLAILWVVADPNVLISDEVQRLIISLLRHASANELRENAQIQAPFMALVGHWMRRSRVEDARDILTIGMQWDMAAESRMLGLRAAYEARELHNVHAGLQAIARFGTVNDVAAVRPFLQDQRTDSQEASAEPGRLEVRTSDVAMATIATLYDVPLAEIGFPAANEHAIVAFAMESVGFPADQPELRVAAHKRLQILMANPQNPGQAAGGRPPGP